MSEFSSSKECLGGFILGDPGARPPRARETTWCDELDRRRLPGPSLVSRSDAAAGDSTLCVHAGTTDDPRTGAVGTPIYQSSTFRLDPEQYRSVDDGYARDRFIYSRYGNPSQWAVQEKLAALEGAESAVVFSSGMAAIASTLFALLDPGGHVVASSDVYGGTYSLFQHELPNCGMSATLVDPRDLAGIEAAIEPRTQLIFVEALSNPLLKVADIHGLAAIARRHGLRLVVDATFVTPLGMRPLDLGADLVVHSASKYLNGHSDLIAGVACGSRKLMDRVWARMLNYGGSLDPHACFLLERGLKTLAVRMRAHQESALTIARWLERHPDVTSVLHPLLPSHPDHELARRTLAAGSGMVTFSVAGGDEAALALLDALRLPRQATSLGGVESLVSLPFNTSHAPFTRSQREHLGIPPGCVRLSVGIEDTVDLIEDLEQALGVAAPSRESVHA